MEKIKQFIKEVIAELKKVSWPTMADLKDSTIVVIIAALFLGCFVGFADFILQFMMAFLIR